MIIKITASLIALIVGGWLIFDGIHVVATGKYFGPEKPGPWSDVVTAVGLDPFGLGLPFIALGGFWLLFHCALLLGQTWAWYAALLTAILTLWYLPVGTFLSMLYIFFLIVFPSKLQS